MDKEEKISRLAKSFVGTSLAVQPDDFVVITADNKATDMELADAIYHEVRRIGGESVVVRTDPSESHGLAADKVAPRKGFGPMIGEADFWVDMGSMGWIYSNTFADAFKRNPNLKYFLLSTIPVDQLYNMFVLPPELYMLADKLTEMLTNGHRVHITNGKGTDVTYELTSLYPIMCNVGKIRAPGQATPPAMVNMMCKDGTMNGTIVTNCMYADPWGICPDLVIHVKDSVIVGAESPTDPTISERFLKWLASWEEENIYKHAHMNFGLLPGVHKLLDNSLKCNGISNERMWGAMNWGFGDVPKKRRPPHGQPSKNHLDCITEKISAWIDDIQIMQDGNFIYGDLKNYADITLKKIEEDDK